MTSSYRCAALVVALAVACTGVAPIAVAGAACAGVAAIAVAAAAPSGFLPASLRLDFGFASPPGEDKLASRVAAIAVTGSQDGEDFATAKPIAALPFEDLGTTCGFANDLETECTFLGGAPDVVYRYTAAADAIVDIDVCDNGYDAALHVYRAPGIPIDCNDDACGRGPRIAGLALQAGETYYFVLDGWYGACGGYRLSIVTDPAPCSLDLPSSTVPEGEPACADDVYDRFNAGCNDFPYSFRRLDCNADDIVVAGSYGTFDYYADEFRDTDWYEVVVPVPGVLAAEVLGAAATELAILDGRNGCGDYGPICGSVFSEPCQPLECETVVEPGTYWIFVATRWYTGIRCPTAYRLSVRGAHCGTVPVTDILVERIEVFVPVKNRAKFPTVTGRALRSFLTEPLQTRYRHRVSPDRTATPVVPRSLPHGSGPVACSCRRARVLDGRHGSFWVWSQNKGSARNEESYFDCSVPPGGV